MQRRVGRILEVTELGDHVDRAAPQEARTHPLTSTRVEGSSWRGPPSMTRSSWLPKTAITSSAVSAGRCPVRLALLATTGPPMRPSSA